MVYDKWGGFAGLPLHVNLMQAIGWLMVLFYLYLWFAPYSRFKAALSAGEPSLAAKNLNQIRWIVTGNLVLGLVTVAIAAAGRYVN